MSDADDGVVFMAPHGLVVAAPASRIATLERVVIERAVILFSDEVFGSRELATQATLSLRDAVDALLREREGKQ